MDGQPAHRTGKRRRRLVLAGVAGVAVLAGVGWSLWRRQGSAGESAVLWEMRFDQPDGGQLSMASLRGGPLVLNFWATWCAPCVKEMPELDRFHRDYAHRGWRVLGLAIDGPNQVREFLKRVPVGFAIGLAGAQGTDLMRALGNSQGALPFTVVLDRAGRPVHRRLGETRYSDLVTWAAGV